MNIISQKTYIFIVKIKDELKTKWLHKEYRAPAKYRKYILIKYFIS